MTPRIKSWVTTIGQVVAILVPLSAATGWLWTKADAAGREYVLRVTNPEISRLASEQANLSETQQQILHQLEVLTQQQTDEAVQSGDEAETNRQILCLLRAMTNNEALPGDVCE